MKIPKGHYIFGTVKVGERGQMIIPKEARKIFDIKAGDTLIVLGDEKVGTGRHESGCFGKTCDECLSKNFGGTNR